jgi:predicted RNA-binding Zn-ribbon protein involved in translation (DUF1610 family)
VTSAARDPNGTAPGGLPLAVDAVVTPCPDCAQRRVHKFSDDLGAHYQCSACAWETFIAWADLEQRPTGAPAPPDLCVETRPKEDPATMPLPTTKQTRAAKSPLDVRVLLAGMPKAGKTTLAAQWAPDETLIIDTQQGTTLLSGEHYVAHITDWPAFETTVDELVAGGHQFKTVVIDLVDDIWNFVDAHRAGKNAVLASATEDYSRSLKSAEGTFRQTIGRLLATGLGLWFITHTKAQQDGNLTRYVPRLDQRALCYVHGACEVILLAETLGPRRVLHTAPSAKFEAGSRFPLPEPMDLDARALYAAMAKGLKAPTATTPAPQTNEKTDEKVAA